MYPKYLVLNHWSQDNLGVLLLSLAAETPQSFQVKSGSDSKLSRLSNDSAWAIISNSDNI